MKITVTHPLTDNEPTDYELTTLNMDSGLTHLIVEGREPDCDCGTPLRYNDLIVMHENHSPLYIAHAACFVAAADLDPE